MKKTFKNKGVATIEELRSICQDKGVKLIGCQMIMDVFGCSKKDFIYIILAKVFLEKRSDTGIHCIQ